MKTQLICIGGWGFNHHVFDKLVNQLDPFYERLDINSTLLEMPKLNQKEKIIITWSFGYVYFLEHLMSRFHQ